MYLENISLINFKNYDELNLKFSSQVNCFVGENGSGKTNLLDAIHYLSMTKSAFHAVEQQTIRHEAPFFMVQGQFIKEKKHHIFCSFQSGQKKVFKHNKKPYEKISEHIGDYPLVLIAPDDTDVIREGSELRRRFFDSILSQIDKDYLHTLMRYNHILKQRNSLMKQFSMQNYFDKDLLEPYNIQLLEHARAIFNKRKSFIFRFSPLVKKHYANISDGKEAVELLYQSELDMERYEAFFIQNIKKDLMMQRTTSGVHKDDFEFMIDNYSLKKTGSQGQQKSFLIALKLAHFDVMKDDKGFKPLLLLDDIFDKLDDKRIGKLLDMIANNVFGQLFVTDARPERTSRIFEHLPAEVKVFNF